MSISKSLYGVLATTVIAVLQPSCDHSIRVRPSGVMPVEIRNVDPGELKLDGFNWESSILDGTFLHLEVTSGGGCREHSYTLTMTPAAFMESHPVQAHLYLRHDDDDDPCDAIVHDSVVFDLTGIVQLYRQMYGDTGEIHLNLHNFEQSASTRLTLTVN